MANLGEPWKDEAVGGIESLLRSVTAAFGS